ncbi:unnamed protein product [Enterobius vermicularis]|uniref:START domain-containing protein n=1 Tax=Enterobius vermicularis TaxID=51028 RepID=A0A0N4V166_ENTVE|nr:unnamed protein product [Enterobius vermicularis]
MFVVFYIQNSYRQRYQENCKAQLDGGISRAEALFSSLDSDSKEGWKMETESAPLETKIYSKKEAEGKLFALQAEVECSPDVFLKDYWDGFCDVPKWNPSIAFSQLVVKLTDQMDIAYYRNKDVFAVKARDFVLVRGYKKLDNGVSITVAKSIELDRLPVKKECVRGELMLGAGRFSPKKDNPNVTVIDYLLSIDLKGLLPKLIVNTVCYLFPVQYF